MAGLVAAVPLEAGAEVELETLTVEKSIKEGPNVFLVDWGINVSSKITVLGADDLSMKGNMGAGAFAQAVLSADGNTLYTASVYLSRYTYGDLTAVMHEYDVATLTARREFVISEKLAQAESQPALLALTPDERFMIVQNATPATSVSIVDLEQGKEIAEVPTPGCWGGIPAIDAMQFTALCGDGTMISHSFDGKGGFSDPARSKVVFDPEADALFTNPIRNKDGDLVFMSFNGNFYVVKDSNGAPELIGKHAIGGADAGWAPGGSEVMTYHAPTDTAFISMHSKAYDGSHKNGAEEIWAVDMTTMKLVGRIKGHHENSVYITQTEQPTLFGSGESGGISKYTIGFKGGQVSGEKVGDFGGLAFFPTLVFATQ
jgi:methylamine dehydrogenase heavy chain